MVFMSPQHYMKNMKSFIMSSQGDIKTEMSDMLLINNKSKAMLPQMLSAASK